MKVANLSLCVLIFLLALSAKTFAADFTVTRNDDRNSVCAVGDCSLREAVNAANASATNDTISFASGLTTITLNNKEIAIANAGALTINGPGANILTIDGGAGTNRIFVINEATTTISGITLTGGNGTGASNSGSGGAINAAGGSLTLDSIHITGNATYNTGSALFYGGTHRIINSTFSANSASYCGGFDNYGGTLTVVNSTISNNQTTDGLDGIGGGFCNEGDTTLRNTTITNNDSDSYAGGGGIFNSGTLNFGNTVVAGNHGVVFSNSNRNEIYNFGGVIISAGGNLVGGSPGNSAIPGIAYQPTDIRDTNPMLGALQNNGGTTPTHALLSGSPAIDKGLNSLAVDPFNNSILQTDQRGLARFLDGNGDGVATVDIGAYESPATKSKKRVRIIFGE